MRTLFKIGWPDWRIGLAIAALLMAAAGLVSAWLTPRGPVTTFQALISMATALLVGLAAGFVMNSRWCMLVTPMVFMVVYELVQMKVQSPTVDAIHLNSTYGIIAFVMGRLVYGILVLAPMILGSLYGTEFAARVGATPAHHPGTLGRIFNGFATLDLIIVTILVIRSQFEEPEAFSGVIQQVLEYSSKQQTILFKIGQDKKT